MLAVATDLSDATNKITAAVGDCGSQSSECIADVKKIANALASASTDVSKALTSCEAGKKLACGLDVAGAVASIGFCTDDIVHAVKDCKKK